jgi:hypothetical protein
MVSPKNGSDFLPPPLSDYRFDDVTAITGNRCPPEI